MEQIWIYTLLSVLVVSVISLIGALTFFISEEKIKKLVFYLVSLSIGALFGDVFIHILPELFEEAIPAENTLPVSLLVLFGIFFFFAFEKFLYWRHNHAEDIHKHEEDESLDPAVKPLGHVVLLSDIVHNFVDGIIIGVSYLVALPVGIATTIAVILHEIPQEMGDFALLLHAGFTKKKALFLNFLSAISAVLGAIIALSLGTSAEEYIMWALPVAAGGFIYIAGSDLIPELHKESRVSRSLLQFLFIAIGIGIMFALTYLE